MSARKGILATVLSVGTAAVTLAKTISDLWREREPEPIRPDRYPLDELRRKTTYDKR